MRRTTTGRASIIWSWLCSHQGSPALGGDRAGDPLGTSLDEPIAASTSAATGTQVAFTLHRVPLHRCIAQFEQSLLAGLALRQLLDAATPAVRMRTLARSSVNPKLPSIGAVHAPMRGTRFPLPMQPSPYDEVSASGCGLPPISDTIQSARPVVPSLHQKHGSEFTTVRSPSSAAPAPGCVLIAPGSRVPAAVPSDVVILGR